MCVQAGSDQPPGWLGSPVYCALPTPGLAVCRYAAAGYTIVWVDDCWAMRTRNATTDALEPDPERWPRGIQFAVDYVHAKGLKFGLCMYMRIMA